MKFRLVQLLGSAGIGKLFSAMPFYSWLHEQESSRRLQQAAYCSSESWSAHAIADKLFDFKGDEG